MCILIIVSWCAIKEYGSVILHWNKGDSLQPQHYHTSDSYWMWSLKCQNSATEISWPMQTFELSDVFTDTYTQIQLLAWKWGSQKGYLNLSILIREMFNILHPACNDVIDIFSLYNTELLTSTKTITVFFIVFVDKSGWFCSHSPFGIWKLIKVVFPQIDILTYSNTNTWNDAGEGSARFLDFQASFSCESSLKSCSVGHGILRKQWEISPSIPDI